MMIYLQELDQSLERISKRDMRLCVVGVGTIGLPLATFLANSGFKVTGLDVNQARVDQVNSGNVPFEYPQMLKKAVESGSLRATIDTKEAVADAEAIFVCVPTPLNKERAIDLSKLSAATGAIASELKPGSVVIFESSVSVGATREMGKTIEEKTGMKMGKGFGLAYCPERYNPTLPTEIHPHVVYNSKNTDSQRYTLDKISRVVGGIDDKSRAIAKMLYAQIISAEIKEVSSIEAAEATKLLENIFRDVNIALVNELAKVYPKFGLDVYEIINAAKTKPFAFLPHYPGAGVGGECIPVDTWYLIKQAEKIGISTPLMRIAREINDSMPYHLVDILEKELKIRGKDLNGSMISLLGLSYKKNIHDTRLSPAFVVADILKSKNANVMICDPVVEAHNGSHKTVPLSEAFKGSDAIVLVTDHDVFSTIDFEKVKSDMRTPIIIDGRNFFDGKKLTSLGFHYKSIGRPE